MQIPIINGVYTDMQANYRTAYPRNLVPVPKQNGIAEGYLRVFDGLSQFAAPLNILGSERGGINWNGVLYRVVGSKLVSYAADGTPTIITDVGNDGQTVVFDYSFDYLAVASAGKLYYYSPAGVSTALTLGAFPGGSGYVVGDTVQFTNGIWATVTAVGGGGIVTGLSMFETGISLTAKIPANPQPQLTTTGAGSGLAVNITWQAAPNNTVQVTTSFLGTVVDFLWMAGYFVSTDGTNIIPTDLTAPTHVIFADYGSSEADPDPIVGLVKYRNELYVFNRYTCEVFDNVGGGNFPFQANEGAIVEKGALSRRTKCKFAQQVAFVGSARNEPSSIYLIAPGFANKIATQEVEEVLRGYTEDVLAASILEAREDRIHQHLFFHLPDQTLVYDYAASQIMQQPIWFALSTDASSYGRYRARHFVYCYDKWTCGDVLDSRIGYLDRTVATAYGALVGWQFDISFLYNEHKGAIIQVLELIGLTGRAPAGTNPTISMSYTRDGLTYGNERFVKLGSLGQYQKRMQWLNALFFREVASMRFRGTTPALCSFTRLEADINPLTK
jgi:hypothetical protein